MVSFKLFLIGFIVTTPGARLDGGPRAGADEHQVSSALGVARLAPKWPRCWRLFCSGSQR